MTSEVPGTFVGIVPLRLSSVTILNRQTGLLRHTSVLSDASAIFTVLRDTAVAYEKPLTVAIDMPGWRPGAVALEDGYRAVQLRTETAMRWVAAAELLVAGHGFAIVGQTLDVRLLRTRLRDCVATLSPHHTVGPWDAGAIASRLLGAPVPTRHAHSCLLALWAATVATPARAVATVAPVEPELRHG